MAEAKDENQEFPDHGENWVTRADAEMKVKVGDSGVASVEPLTVMQVFKNTVNKFGGRLALTDKHGRTWTWDEYYNSVRGAHQPRPLHSGWAGTGADAAAPPPARPHSRR